MSAPIELCALFAVMLGLVGIAPSPSWAAPGNVNVSISPVPGALAGTPAHPYLTGLREAGLDPLDASQVEVVDAGTVLSGPDLAALARELAEEPRATEGATSLTLDLRKRGLIPGNEEVIGRNGKTVLKASSDQVSRLQH
jgi:hypothetical protein